MNNDTFTREELTEAENLDAIIDTLQRGDAPNNLASTPEQKRAVWMHVRTSNTEIDPAFEKKLGKELTQRFAHNPTRRRWLRVWIPATGVAVVVLGVAASTYRQPFNATNTTSNTPYVAVGNTDSEQSATNTIHATTNAENNSNTAPNSNGDQSSGNNTNSDNEGNKNTSAYTEDDFVTSDIDAELAAVTPDLDELTTLNHTMQSAIDDISDVLDSIDAMESAVTDTSSAASAIDQLAI